MAKESQSQLEKAIRIALGAHIGQVDKAGESYILHPLRLMVQMDTDEKRIIAVLHDVVEDSDWTFENLKQEGFSDEVIEALRCLTKRDGEDYLDFVRRASSNPTARVIKIVDVKDNMDIGRIANPTDKDFERIEKKYKPALKILD